jgi:replicative DNA helicase
MNEFNPTDPPPGTPQPPPNNKKAEEALIGSILINPDIEAELSIIPEDFYIIRHQWIWEAFQQLKKEGVEIDYLTTINELDKRGRLAELGGPAYLTSLINSTPTSYHAPGYAKIVKEDKLRRMIIQVANELAKEAYSDETPNVEDSIRKLGDLIYLDKRPKEVDGEAIRKYVLDRLENPIDPLKPWGIPMPWDLLNKATGGLHKGRATLIKGESGLGKTIMVCQLAKYAAECGYNVDIYELEMSEEDLMLRWISADTEIETHKIHRGDLSDYDQTKIFRAVERIEKLPIRVDTNGWSSAEIRADQTKKKARGERVDLVVVDYLGLVKERSDIKAWEQVEYSAKALRQAAKELDFALVTVVSEVKDGSIKGSAEVRYAADDIWELKKTEGDAIDVRFYKSRYGGGVSADTLGGGAVTLYKDRKYPKLK